jgi:hypothetical protein
MASRKRRSETAVVNNDSKEYYDAMMTMDESSDSVLKPSATTNTTTKSRIRVRIRRFHGVAQWTWVRFHFCGRGFH